jgi:hypothetical protein
MHFCDGRILGAILPSYLVVVLVRFVPHVLSTSYRDGSLDIILAAAVILFLHL